MFVAQIISMALLGGIRKAVGRRSMRKRYAENTAKSADKWKKEASKSASDYAKAMAKFGAPVGKTLKNYKKGIQKARKTSFAKAVKESDSKWLRKLREAVC